MPSYYLGPAVAHDNLSCMGITLGGHCGQKGGGNHSHNHTLLLCSSFSFADSQSWLTAHDSLSLTPTRHWFLVLHNRNPLHGPNLSLVVTEPRCGGEEKKHVFPLFLPSLPFHYIWKECRDRQPSCAMSPHELYVPGIVKGNLLKWEGPKWLWFCILGMSKKRCASLGAKVR